jgi:hypothetical protein
MSFKVDVDGVGPLINQLERFDKDVAKVLKTEMRAGANEVAKAAREMIPESGLRNWGAWTYSKDGRDLGFIGSWVKRGITVSQQRNRQSGITIGFGYDVVTKTPAGSIYELAGSKSDEPMSRAMRKKHPVTNYPRTLFEAYYAGMPQAKAKIEAAIKKAEEKVGR